MSSRKKKAPTTPPAPRPPAYRWSDWTSYSQTAGDRRGEKEPTKFELSDANRTSMFSSESPFHGLTIEREQGGYRVTTGAIRMFDRIDAVSASDAKRDAPYVMIAWLRAQLSALEEATALLERDPDREKSR